MTNPSRHFSVEVWGDFACFTRPEMKTERVSYECMTPSAARGILESIYWHPGMQWCVDSIRVCNPIQFTNIRRNEVKGKISLKTVKSQINNPEKELFLNIVDSRTQRASMILRDVRYVIDAHFEMTKYAQPRSNPQKIQAIVERRLAKGQCYSMPYLGCREFPAQFKACETVPPCPNKLLGTYNLSWMLFDMSYPEKEKKGGNITPLFFHAELIDGVLHVPTPLYREVTT